MRICLDISPAVHGRAAGLGRYARDLTSALAAIEHENQYSVFYNDPASAHVNPPLDQLPHFSTTRATKPWRMTVLASHLLGLSQDALAPGVDIFHATDHLLPRFVRVKSVFTLHDLAFQVFPETHTRLNRSFLSVMMPRFLRAADAIITVSQWSKADAIRLYGIPEHKITVIYEGVHPRFLPPTADDVAAVRRTYNLPERFILYVGTIEPRKNLGVLVDAYALLRKQGVCSDVRLVIAGKMGWLYEPFLQHLRELGLQDEVLLPGFIADEDLPALYGAGGVFAFPSLFEGFGLPVLEAMACGAPVVCSNASSLPEVAGDAALLVDPHDTSSLAAAMQRVLTDAELRAKLSAQGIVQARRFTWEQAARQTAAVYRQVYEKGNDPRR
jgi:glycosyltransferase involved in cell wall biosynthesis